MLSPEDFNFFGKVFASLSPEDILHVYELAETKNLSAGQVYIREGALSQKLALIKQGLIRAYQKRPNGEEITLMLRWEHQFLASVDGILHQRPSRFIYQALEDTTLLEVDYARIPPIIDNNPRLSAARNALLMQMLAQAMERIENFVLLSPEERYLRLISEKPGIVNRVPDKYIATLLGITPVSLSRIRQRIARRSSSH